MKRLLISGIIYLIGVAVILALKPQFMFREDGVWKEFGIGRNSRTHTWFPFWLFVIVWAVFSYIITSLVIPGAKVSGIQDNSSIMRAVKKIRKSSRPVERELEPGYYVLNREGSEDGVPRYVYLGPAGPGDNAED